MHLPELDQALAPVAQNLAHRGDDLLDLRDAVLEGTNPGRCLSCYYKIYGSAPSPEPILAPLRRWLESHLEIVAKDQEQRELERLPVRLHRHDLESFCQEMMDEILWNRTYQADSIELTLDFKQQKIA